MPAYPKTCVICGKPFIAKTIRIITCSPVCSQINKAEYSKSYAKKVYEKTRAGKLVKIICARCGKIKYAAPERIYCSAKCEDAALAKLKAQQLEKVQKRAYNSVKSVKNLSLTEVQKRAQAQGLSYGQYLAKEACRHG